MDRWARRWMALLCAALLCFSVGGAGAEFSPCLTALVNGDGLLLTVDAARFETLYPLSEDSRNIVNSWLSDWDLRLIAWERPGRIQSAAIERWGQPLILVSAFQTADGTITAFSPSGGAYRTKTGEKDALALLAGGDAAWDLPDPTALARLYDLIAPDLYPLLAEYVSPRKIQDSTSVKNALSSPSYENYVFKDEELNALWPQVMNLLTPALRTALVDWPYWERSIENVLTETAFSGECRFKRMLDKNGGDMGLQFTGQAESGASGKRKVTLFGGFTPGRGGYVSLALPAVSGKDTLKISFGGRLTEGNGQNTLTFDGAYTRTENGVTESAELEGSLKNAIKNGAEKWTGKITLTDTQGKTKTVWTLTPEVTSQEDHLACSLTVQKKVGSTVHIKAYADLTLYAAPVWDAPETPENALDLRGLNEASARARVLSELAPLTRTLLQMFSGLTETQRTLLTHDLRTEAWMNGPLVPALGEPPAPNKEPDQDTDQRDDWDQWSVVE